MKLLMKFHAAMPVLCCDEKPVQIEQRPAMRTREVGPMGSSDKLRCAPVQLPGQVPARFAAQVVWFPHQVPEVVRFWKVSVQCPGQVQEASGAAESQCMCSAASNDQKRFLIAAAVGIPSKLFTAESPFASISSIFFFF